MSTNTTGTSDPFAADSLASSAAQESTQKVGSESPLAAALPDPAVIARLANEFFAALPGTAEPQNASGPAASANEVDLRLPSGSAPRTAVPDYQREMFSFPAAQNSGSVPALPQTPSTLPIGALNEADFQAIASSLAGMVALVPQFPTPAAPPAIPSPSLSSLEGEKTGPWAAAPQFPPALEMFSFPGVPAIPSSPPTAPPSGSDLAKAPSSPASATASVPSVPIAPTPYQTPGTSGGNRTDPWATAPNFSNEIVSFPGVPGASAPGVPEQRVPETIVSQPSVPVSSASPDPPHSANDPQSTPAVPKSVQSPAILENTADSADAARAVYGKAAPTFPPVTEMFSLPGVPGLQSPPGVPVLPSSGPTRPLTEADLRALSATLPGATAATTPPGVPQPAVPSVPGNTSYEEGTPKQSASLPKRVESFEFRPDLAPGDLGVAKRPLDPRLIRQDFPILQERVHGRQLIWLDNAATTQKPNAVIDRLAYFYQHENSNVHRAAHTLAARATDAYESAREKTRSFLNASSTREIVFVRGTTEGINLIAQAWGRRNV